MTCSPRGVRIAGSGHFLPEKRLTNADLEKIMDTSDEWIVQRTGIRERRVADRSKGEGTIHLATRAAERAIADAGLEPTDLDLLILATMTEESCCPANACRVADNLGAGHIGAFDLNAACSGLVYSTNIGHDLIAMGQYNTVCAIGCDTLSNIVDYSTRGRSTAILFGDASSAVVLKATDDRSKGIIAQSMHADGGGGQGFVRAAPESRPAGGHRVGGAGHRLRADERLERLPLRGQDLPRPDPGDAGQGRAGRGGRGSLHLPPVQRAHPQGGA